MIHDPYVDVTCDGKRPGGKECNEHIDVEDGRDSEIARRLEDREWFVTDSGHYCSRECVPRAERKGLPK